MTVPTQDKVQTKRRVAAVAALLAIAAAIASVVLGLLDNVDRFALSLLLLLVVAMSVWFALTRRGFARIVGYAAGFAAVVALVWVILTGERHGLLLVVVAILVSFAGAASKYALSRDTLTLEARTTPGTSVGPAQHGVLIMNPKSGGGKAERFELQREAEARGIEPVVLKPGDDLLELARDAIARGADVIGMAGGDGSQALVASIAKEHDVPLVCIPAGTRNHFALDIGLDRDDVVGALAAFDHAVERRIDLATVNDRVFVNNVSLGLYAKIVQAPEYRDAKGKTTTDMLPELLGPHAEPFDLRFTDGGGVEHGGAQVIQVSNNPYVLTRLGGFGTRVRMDTGELGVVAVEIRGETDVAQILTFQSAGRINRFRGWHEWSAPTFEVRSGAKIEAGVDGEALLLDPPLDFRCLPSALRVRIPKGAPGVSPAARVSPTLRVQVTALLGVIVGRPV